MVTINHNYLKLPGSYLFSTIAKKVKAYREENPEKKIISLGIGDVTLQQKKSLFPTVRKAIPEISRRFSGLTTRWLSVTLFTRFMWIPMSWQDVPESTILQEKILTA